MNTLTRLQHIKSVAVNITVMSYNPYASLDAPSQVISSTGSSYSPDKVELIRGKLAQTTDVMKDNIEIVIDRGVKIEDMAPRAQQLSDNALLFNKEALRLRRKERRKYWCQKAKIGSGILLIILFMCLIIYWATKRS